MVETVLALFSGGPWGGQWVRVESLPVLSVPDSNIPSEGIVGVVIYYKHEIRHAKCGYLPPVYSTSQEKPDPKWLNSHYLQGLPAEFLDRLT